MVIFHSYVKLPEGITRSDLEQKSTYFRTADLGHRMLTQVNWTDQMCFLDSCPFPESQILHSMINCQWCRDTIIRKSIQMYSNCVLYRKCNISPCVRCFGAKRSELEAICSIDPWPCRVQYITHHKCLVGKIDAMIKISNQSHFRLLSSVSKATQG